MVAGDVQWTYREVNERANQLAHDLQKRGVRTETLVGLGLERSVETVIGMLAILKTGGAYVPFDLGYPSERIAYMLADTQVRVLLTSQHLLNKLEVHKVETICLDSEWERIGQESVKNLAVECRAEQLAYVTYTSGSTGNPKGVCVPHRGVVR